MNRRRFFYMLARAGAAAAVAPSILIQAQADRFRWRAERTLKNTPPADGCYPELVGYYPELVGYEVVKDPDTGLYLSVASFRYPNGHVHQQRAPVFGLAMANEIAFHRSLAT